MIERSRDPKLLDNPMAIAFAKAGLQPSQRSTGKGSTSGDPPGLPKRPRQDARVATSVRSKSSLAPLRGKGYANEPRQKGKLQAKTARSGGESKERPPQMSSRSGKSAAPYSMFGPIRVRPTAAAERANDPGAASRRLEERLRHLPVDLEARSKADATAAVATLDERDALDTLVGRGFATDLEITASDAPLEAVVGFDFGTSSTKIVIRLPYEAGGPAGPVLPVDVPGFARAEQHPYLWASRLWLTADGLFTLAPEPGAQVFCAIKTALMFEGQSTGVPAGAVSATEIAAAFLALQLLRARGWMLDRYRRGRHRRRFTWSYNFGFPAASLDDWGLAGRYRRCCAAALELIRGEPQKITLKRVRASLATVGGDAQTRLDQAHAALAPEIAAAVAGFAKSTSMDEGLYALVDVGGGTLDCCTFNLLQDKQGGERCPIFLADVRMLGVEPWRLCEPDPSLAGDFHHELRRCEMGVIWDTKAKRFPTSPRWKEGLPVFFVGGGAKSKPHRQSVQSLDTWLKEAHAAGSYLIELPLPDGLDPRTNAVDLADRLAVAIGLSLPAVDIPEVRLPHSIEDHQRGPQPDFERRFVGKDQV